MKSKLLTILLFSICFVANAQEQTFKEDVQKLMKIIGIEEQISYTREDMIMWTTPVKEKELIADFDATVPVFKADVEEYYLTKYTHSEIKEILAFYESPIGKKLVADNKFLLDLNNTEEEKYYDGFTELMFAKKDKG